ncbi:MAG TPA: response regulator [Candidatus Hydrogenedentes bacterium]|nr:response regulator [Candidatus Hydrogenedentota bacterium]HOS02092.1 response regulator [Candidatus Hydrogenedentota bacterium]
MGKAKVLVVDDEPDLVEFIARLLRAEGFDVLTAYDGINAMDMTENERPDIILLDIMMPMVSGYEVCQQIKANPMTRNIPILCMTSAHSIDARARSRQAGAATVIVKPFTPAELVAQVRRHLPEADDLQS